MHDVAAAVPVDDMLCACMCFRSGSSAKRMLPKYSVQQLPHKKRVKLAAAACDGWDMYGGYVSHGHYQTQSGGIYPAGVAQYGYYDGAAAAAAMGGTGAQGLQQEEGAFRVRGKTCHRQHDVWLVVFMPACLTELSHAMFRDPSM